MGQREPLALVLRAGFSKQHWKKVAELDQLDKRTYPEIRRWIARQYALHQAGKTEQDELK